MTPGKTLVKYTDTNQSTMFVSTSGFTSAGLGGADSDELLERNEIHEFKLSSLHSTGAGSDQLTRSLGPNTTFSLEIIPPSGAVLFIKRTTPVSFDNVVFLN